MNLKARFKPRAEAGLLFQLVQSAWQDYHDRIVSKERQTEVAETIACYFETLIPAADFAVLQRYNCITWHDRVNVRVYDAATDNVAKYREAFGVKLSRKVPVLRTGGYEYPSLTCCEPVVLRGEKAEVIEARAASPLRALDGYFFGLLTARKQYLQEYKASMAWPQEYGKEHGKYPTWGEIAEKFPVLGEWIKRTTEVQP